VILSKLKIDLGHGESFLRKAVASRIAISYGLQNKPIDTLCKDIIDNDLQGINAGIIAVDHKGEIAVEANSKMFYGTFKNGILTGDITSLDDNPFSIKLF
jgi:isoaspartyl peptidase/L-asparaginase-like protein (Ntn-hydrolase superfamily)